MDNPRIWAFNLLWQVMRGKRHLQNLLEDEFKGKADSRDKAFCQNLLYSTLRNWLWLEFLLGHVTKIKRLQTKVLYLLLLAVAELKFMRTPDYAALSAWVDVSRGLNLGRASGLVNAVLRALTRMEQEPEVTGEDQARYLSIKYSHPLWLVRLMLEQFGATDTLAWLSACQQMPELTIRVNTLKTTPQQLTEYLRPHAGNITAHELHPWSLVVSQPRQPLPGFREGLWQGQDAGATALTELLGVTPHSRVLDMCAGAGGKSGHLAQLMQNRGELLAMEITSGRAKAWRENMARLGVSNARLLQQDACNLPTELHGSFDYILLDAPCSGLGTTGRRPDVRWRRGPKDISALAEKQKQLLSAAVSALKPGGALLYATCTGIIAENEDNIKWLLANYPQMRIGWQEPLVVKDNFWRTYPRPMGCDGFFAARLIKE